MRVFKGIVISVYRAFIGALYGMLLWAPVGTVLLVALLWRRTDFVGLSSELHVWVGLLALIGGFIGALVGVGGGVFSGIVTGALIGYFGWLAIGDPASVGAATTGGAAELSVLIVLGTGVGMTGGLVGGLVSGIAGTSPAQGEGQVKAGVLLGIFSLLSFSSLIVLILQDTGVVSEVIDYLLAGTGSAYAVPEPDPEPLMTFGGGMAAILVGLVLVAALPALSGSGRMADENAEAVPGFLRQMQLNLWHALLPLSVGLICEILVTRAIGSLMGEARVGVGALLGVGVASGLQEWIENRSEESGQSRRRSGTVVWAAIIAAIVITALQGYLFPAM